MAGRDFSLHLTRQRLRRSGEPRPGPGATLFCLPPFAPAVTVSPAARLLAAGGALVAAAYLLAERPLALVALGCPGSAAALVLAALPLVAFLGLLAASPSALQGILSRWSRADLRDPGHVGASVVLAATLFVTLGWGGFASGVATVESVLGGCNAGAPLADPTADALVFGVVVSFGLFTLPTLLYVGVVHGLGPAATFRALGLRNEGAGRALALGAGLAVGFLVALGLAVAVVSLWIPEEVLRNEQALAIAGAVTLPVAFLLALGSGMGEEIFFRGFLQPRLGLVTTSLVFSLAHLNYGSISEVVVVFVLSLALGVAYRATGNLWTVVAAHFTFNFIQLTLGMYAVEHGS